MFYNKEYKLYIIDIHISEKLVNDSLKFFFFRSNNNNTLLKKIEFNNNISNDLLDKKMRIGFFLHSYAHFNEKKPIFFKVDEYIRFYFNLN